MSRKWTLVECEIEKKVVNGKPLTEFRPTATNPEYRPAATATATATGASGRAENERRRRSSRAFGRDRSSSVDDYGLEEEPPLDAQQLAYAVHVAILNIEYLFSAESLIQDVYLRSLMDHEGFVPLVYVMQYPDLMYSPAPSEAILQGLAQSSTSRIEVDAINETLRLRVGWKPFLLPNDKGGVGLVHRYIKDSSSSAAPSSSSSSSSIGNSALSADAAPFAAPLRAVANEFVPKV